MCIDREIRSAKGNLDALLFRSADGFPDEPSRAFDTEAAPIDLRRP
jgi:hypothetical protein